MLNTPPGPTLLGIDVIFAGTLLAGFAAFAVMFAIYTVVTIRDPMQKRVKASSPAASSSRRGSSLNAKNRAT